MLVRRKKSGFAFRRFDRVQFAVAVSLDLERLEELPPLVHFECARLFLFVNDIRRCAGRDADRVSRKLVHLAGIFKFSGLGNVFEPLENERFDRVVFVRHGLGRVHAFDKIDAFFERLLDLLVI